MTEDTVVDEGLDKAEEDLQAMVSALSQGFYESELRCLKVQVNKWNRRSKLQLSCMLSELPQSEQILKGLGLSPRLQNHDASRNGIPNANGCKHETTSPLEDTSACNKPAASDGDDNRRTSQIHQPRETNARHTTEASQQNKQKDAAREQKSKERDMNVLQRELLEARGALERYEKESSTTSEELQGTRCALKDYQHRHSELVSWQARVESENELQNQELQQQKKCEHRELHEMQKQSKTEQFEFKMELSSVHGELQESRSALQSLQQKHAAAEVLQSQLQADIKRHQEEARQQKHEHHKLMQRQKEFDRIEFQNELQSASQELENELRSESQELEESHLTLQEYQQMHSADVSRQARLEVERELHLEEIRQQKKDEDHMLQKLQRQRDSDCTELSKELSAACQELEEWRAALQEYEQHHESYASQQVQLQVEKELHQQEIQQQKTFTQEMQKQEALHRDELQEELSSAYHELNESRAALQDYKQFHAESESRYFQLEAAVEAEQSSVAEANVQLNVLEAELQDEVKARSQSIELHQSKMEQVQERCVETKASMQELRQCSEDMKQFVLTSLEKQALESLSLVNSHFYIIKHRCAEDALRSRQAGAEITQHLSSEAYTHKSEVQNLAAELSTEQDLRNQSLLEIEEFKLMLARAQTQTDVENRLLREHLQEAEEQCRRFVAEHHQLGDELNADREDLRPEHYYSQGLFDHRMIDSRVEVDRSKSLLAAKSRSNSAGPRSMAPALQGQPNYWTDMANAAGQRGFAGFPTRPLLRPLPRRPSSGSSSGNLTTSESASALVTCSTDASFHPSVRGNKQQRAKSPMLSLVRKGSPYR